MREGVRNRKALLWAYGGLSLLFLYVAWNAEIQHDYRAYVNQWTAILDGLGPWESTDNAYGPLYNAFAPLFDLHPKLPHAVFLASYLAAAGLLVFRLSATGAVSWLGLLLVNPLFLIFGVIYGSNDLLLGAIVLMMLTSWRRSPWTSGALLAVGAGYKLLPLALAPVMATRPDRYPSRRFLSGAAIGSIVIFGIALAIWGGDVWDPFSTGADRKSKMFSIFRYLRGDYSILSPLGIDSIDGAATAILLIAVVGVSAWTWRNAPGTSTAVLLAYTVVLTAYPVGHHQFYLPYVLVTAFALIDEPALVDRRVVTPLAGLLAWVSLFALIYHLTDAYADGAAHIREWLGLPTFALQLWLIIALMRTARSRPKADSQ